MKLSEIAKALDGRVVGDKSIDVVRPVEPGRATNPGDLAIAIDKPAFRSLKDSKARAAVVAEGVTVPEGLLEGYVVASRPRTALAEISVIFEVLVERAPGVDAGASVADDAKLGKGVIVGAGSTVCAGARIGAGSIITENVTIGAGARIGKNCLIHPGVRVAHRVSVGDRVILHSNAVIGADGFSFTTPKRSNFESAKLTGRIESTNEELIRVNSLGAVTLGDDVEVGANSSIDRGTLKDTLIGDGTKIDNQVQVGHNVKIGKNCMICAQVGIAGSAIIGDGVVLAGKVGVADHVVVGENSVIGAGSGLHTKVPPKSIMYGYPAMPMTEAAMHWTYMRRLGDLFKDVDKLNEAAEKERKEKGE
ncbi:MAG: UDP-3-O-(3-hydroxymyristoyl)glucosamine N-acyltransferase [Alphaproteobacteria bacterium]